MVTDGPRKGLAAFSAAISTWIRQAVIQNHTIKVRVSPLPVMAHSIRTISASWGFGHEVFVSQVCRVANW